MVTPRALLTVMAHPDDAELWAGGTIARHIHEGGTATIAALKHDPMLVTRLRRLRSARQRGRSTRRLADENH